ncbi:HNH endonuclease family protein [Streptomyces uncialis]
MNKMKRAALAAALAFLPLTMSTPAHAAESLPLAAAIEALPVADEVRDGYQRSSFKHWNTGVDKTDGCNTRAEVLIAEAVEPPTVGAGCTLTGGSWWSYYDSTTVKAAKASDVDHKVPLAESWDSGARSWTAARREAYANDQAAPFSLVAVTAKSNRSKADKDPANWLPPTASVHCQYVAEWTSTKLRWGLSADPAEVVALRTVARECPTDVVSWEPAA